MELDFGSDKLDPLPVRSDEWSFAGARPHYSQSEVTDIHRPRRYGGASHCVPAAWLTASLIVAKIQVVRFYSPGF